MFIKLILFYLLVLEYKDMYFCYLGQLIVLLDISTSTCIKDI